MERNIFGCWRNCWVVLLSSSLEDPLQEGQEQFGPKLGASGAEFLLLCALTKVEQVAAVRTWDTHEGPREKMLRWWWVPESPALFDP